MTDARRFAESITPWMVNSGYHVGLTGHQIEVPQVVQWAQEAIPAVGQALQLAGPTGSAAASVFTLLVHTTTAGATAEAVGQRLQAFQGNVDLIGLKVVNDWATLIPVLFADDIPADELTVWVHQHATCAAPIKELVVHGILATPRVSCQSLFVYFDERRAAEAAAAATGGSDLYADRQLVTVRGAIVDVTNQQVVMAPADTLSGILRQAIGTDVDEFDAMALRTLLLERRRYV